MKAFVLVNHSSPDKSFELQEKEDPRPMANEVSIESEAFGLNYADIMARNGRYKDAPPKPCVLGYEAAGRIVEVGADVEGLKVGDRVAAFTRFGGYATRVVSDASGVVKIPEDMPVGIALALTVQYSTAWYCAEDCVKIHPGEHVLVQAAAGGVGTALIQMAKRRGAIVYGTAGSEKKLEYLREQGVDFPINYRKEDFYKKIREIRGDEGVHHVFDSLGGKEFAKGAKLLAKGGKIIGLGTASRSDSWANVFGDIGTLLGFGFFSAAFLLLESRGVIGVNMLRIADHRPWVLKSCLENVVRLTSEGVFKPVVGKTFKSDQLAEAHDYLEKRKSMGKVVVEW